MEAMNLSVNQLTGSLDLDTLPAAVRTVCLSQNKFTADPMDGHLSVVGRTTTRLGGSQEPPDSTGTRPGGIG